jgi:hypothetical protein
MNWAKHAADDIVSDDAIDDAAAEKSNTSDWLKWALAASALGAAGFAAWKYRPEIQKALSNVSVFNNATPANKLVGKVTGGATQSPAVVGGMVGAGMGTPLVPWLSQARGGVNADHQYLEGIANEEAKTRDTGRHLSVSDAPVAQGIKAKLESALGAGNAGGLTAALQRSRSDPNSEFSKLLGGQASLGTQGWKDRTTALKQTKQSIKGLRDLGAKVNRSVAFTAVPRDATGAPIAGAAAIPQTMRLGDIHAGDHPFLPADVQGHHATLHGLHNEFGLKTPVSEFHPERLAAGIEGSRALRSGFDAGHFWTRSALGLGGGVAAGAVYDTAAEGFQK